MKQVAIVGIQGVPAKYGGFETLVENIIGDNCCSEVRYTVFCTWGGQCNDTVDFSRNNFLYNWTG